jgi:hypothetical protein
MKNRSWSGPLTHPFFDVEVSHQRLNLSTRDDVILLPKAQFKIKRTRMLKSDYLCELLWSKHRLNRVL